MRTIEEIKELMATDFMNNREVARKFSFTVGDNFYDHFSKVSIINILFYIFASATWLLEKLFETFRTEVNRQIEEILPHRAKWYRDKVLHFMLDMDLVPDSDVYDTSDMTEEEIEEARVVKHAVATEMKDMSILLIKVAGETTEQEELEPEPEEDPDEEENNDSEGDGDENNAGDTSYVEEEEDDEEDNEEANDTGDTPKRVPLDPETERKLKEYINEVKDAGVHIQLINSEPDLFTCRLDILYNPILSEHTVKSACRKAVKNYIENLPFNGEYNNMALLNVLQQVEGVKIAAVKEVWTKTAGTAEYSEVSMKEIPYAGYYKAQRIQINMTAYE
ncbi:MAG: hypothetical protein LUE98_11405 [Tannerellaceae bacterium]|nr:hypothetical protein [Tannerellaceae bacterium]